MQAGIIASLFEQKDRSNSQIVSSWTESGPSGPFPWWCASIQANGTHLLPQGAHCRLFFNLTALRTSREDILRTSPPFAKPSQAKKKRYKRYKKKKRQIDEPRERSRKGRPDTANTILAIRVRAQLLRKKRRFNGPGCYIALADASVEVYLQLCW